jgi:hypothetical protein
MEPVENVIVDTRTKKYICKGVLTSPDSRLISGYLWTLFSDSSTYFLSAIGPLSLFQTLSTSLCIYVHILAPLSCIISHP